MNKLLSKIQSGALITVIALLAACSGEQSEVAENTVPKTYAIGTAGIFHVGGQEVSVAHANVDGAESGTVWASQLLVSYYLPETLMPKAPLVMMPGFGVASQVYLSTPDGREGWALQFLRAGHPVYLVEPANSVRAGFNPDAINSQLLDGASEGGVLFTWAREMAVPRFGFGPEYGTFFEDAQLDPVNYDELTKLFTPVLVPQMDGLTMIADGLPHNLAGLAELFSRIGPSILLVHSATGVPGFAFAKSHPEQVLAVINIEPVGCPSATVSEFPDVPVLSMFGDHMEVREQMVGRQDQCQQVVDALSARGVPAAMLALPDMGIKGNSHFPMSEKNSEQLADLMLDWIEANGI